MFVFRPDNRMPGGRDELRLEADGLQFLHQPMRAFGELFRIIVIGGNAREPQKRIKIFKMTVAHGLNFSAEIN